MYELFSQSAINVMVLAQEEARLQGSRLVDTEHIFLGLISEGKADAFRILNSMGLTLSVARLEVEKNRPDNPRPAPLIPFDQDLSRPLELTPNAKAALRHALTDERKQPVTCIETRNLLLCLLKDPDGHVLQLLPKLKIDLVELVRSIYQPAVV